MALGQLGFPADGQLALRARRAVARNPPRRRSSASARSAVRACSAWRIARIGLNGSMTTETVRRIGPRRSGPRKSGPTSIRGHSAIQYVVCHVPSVRSRPHSASVVIGHGHDGSAARYDDVDQPVRDGRRAGDDADGPRSAGPAKEVGELVRAEYPVDRHVGVGQRPTKGGDLATKHGMGSRRPTIGPATDQVRTCTAR